MLIPRRVLEGIAEGSIDRAYRRWERSRVRPGTRMRTAIGLVEVVDLAVVDEATITDDDARRAGEASAADLLEGLRRWREHPLHRIDLRAAGPDPRVELRGRADLADAERAELIERLARMDAGARGPWTGTVLTAIRDAPGRRAAELAASLGREVPRFKADVRRLKELGLTESLATGYRISPRGRAALALLDPRPPQ